MSLTAAQRADIEQRVDEGAYFLDHVVPGWAYKVDLSKLDLEAYFMEAPDSCGCVVMQVLGGHFMPEHLGVIGSREAGALAFAFLSEAGGHFVGNEGWYYAHELWTEAVLERRPNVLVGGERVAS